MHCLVLCLAEIAAGSESDRVNGVPPPNAAVQYSDAYHEMFDHNVAADDWFHKPYLPRRWKTALVLLWTRGQGQRIVKAPGTVPGLPPSRLPRRDYCDWGLARGEQGLAAITVTWYGARRLASGLIVEGEVPSPAGKMAAQEPTTCSPHCT